MTLAPMILAATRRRGKKMVEIGDPEVDADLGIVQPPPQPAQAYQPVEVAAPALLPNVGARPMYKDVQYYALGPTDFLSEGAGKIGVSPQEIVSAKGETLARYRDAIIKAFNADPMYRFENGQWLKAKAPGEGVVPGRTFLASPTGQPQPTAPAPAAVPAAELPRATVAPGLQPVNLLSEGEMGTQPAITPQGSPSGFRGAGIGVPGMGTQFTEGEGGNWTARTPQWAKDKIAATRLAKERKAKGTKAVAAKKGGVPDLEGITADKLKANALRYKAALAKAKTPEDRVALRTAWQANRTDILREAKEDQRSAYLTGITQARKDSQAYQGQLAANRKSYDEFVAKRVGGMVQSKIDDIEAANKVLSDPKERGKLDPGTDTRPVIVVNDKGEPVTESMRVMLDSAIAKAGSSDRVRLRTSVKFVNQADILARATEIVSKATPYGSGAFALPPKPESVAWLEGEEPDIEVPEVSPTLTQANPAGMAAGVSARMEGQGGAAQAQEQVSPEVMRRVSAAAAKAGITVEEILLGMRRAKAGDAKAAALLKAMGF